MAGTYNVNCALLMDGEISCRGPNFNFIITGNESPSISVQARRSGLMGPVEQLVSGAEHFCALLDSGVVQCWGSNYFQQLGGSPPGGDLLTVVNIPAGKTAVQIDSFENSSCAVLSDGTVWCWGDNASLQLGDDAPGIHEALVLNLESVAAVAVGPLHACARLSRAAGAGVSCWGGNANGQVGVPASSSELATTVTLDPPAEEVQLERSVALASSFSCAIVRAGEVECWGHNQGGRLGAGIDDFPSTHVPQVVQNLSGPARALYRGYSTICALLDGGAFECWGEDAGEGSFDVTNTAQRIVDAGVTGMFRAVSRNFVRLEDGEWLSWGRLYNSEQLARVVTSAYDTISPVPCCWGF